RGSPQPMISPGGATWRSRRPRVGSSAVLRLRPVDNRGGTMPKTVPNGPGLEPGPYPFSKVVEANGFVFLAGQVGDAPGSHGAVPGGIEPETRAVPDNVGRLLRAVGLDYGDIVRCTVYLRDFGDFAKMNGVYRT